MPYLKWKIKYMFETTTQISIDNNIEPMPCEPCGILWHSVNLRDDPKISLRVALCSPILERGLLGTPRSSATYLEKDLANGEPLATPLDAKKTFS
jgi:hypothetical protein